MTEQPRDPPQKYTRSWSQYSKYLNCSEAFFLERMVKPRLPRRPASWMLGGVAFHDVIDAWETDDGMYESPRSFDIFSRFDTFYWEEVEREKEKQPDLNLWFKPWKTKTVEQDIKDRHQKLRKCLEVFVKDAESGEWEYVNDPDTGRPMIEWAFELEFGGVPVRGAIDAVKMWVKGKNAGKIRVEDAKTGNRVESAGQLGLYKVVVNKLLGSDLREGDFFYLKDGVRVTHSLNFYTEKFFDKVFYDLDAAIDKRLFFPNPGKGCDTCGVRPWCREFGIRAEEIQR